VARTFFTDKDFALKAPPFVLSWFVEWWLIRCRFLNINGFMPVLQVSIVNSEERKALSLRETTLVLCVEQSH
jgi:flagellar biosynthesis protein FliR